MAATLSRRDRVRAATVQEIKDTARGVLVENGPAGLSLRAIAREMGMTAPALYRYFPSRGDLIEHLIADLYDELSDALEQARDVIPRQDVPGRIIAVARRFRTWALENRREFGLLFGSPIEGYLDPQDDGPKHVAGRRFGGVFGALVAQLYAEGRFTAPTSDILDPKLVGQLETWCQGIPTPLPLGVAQILLSSWIRLYGMVCMEVFGHLKFAVQDSEPVFEHELRSLAESMGIGERL